MKRLVPWLCCAVMGLSLCSFAGCGQTGKPANEIKVWHWMTDRQDAFEALALKYEQETGIHVTFSLFAPSDAYTQKIIAAAQASVLPDVYGILDERVIIASFIKEGYVADLTAEFQADGGAWEKSLFGKAVDNNRFVEGNVDGVQPGIYGVPLDVSSIQMIYNRALLKKAGIADPPATFNEFLDAVRSLRRVGIAPFVAGFGELWLVECFASNYAFNIMGEAKVMATFRGEVPYTDPDWIEVFTVFRTLAEKRAFIDGIVTKGNKYAEQDFALERAAFSFDGSWAVNIYRTMNPSLDYGVLPLPAVKAGAPMRMWGGAGSSFVVNRASPNREKAIAFLKWLTDKPQQKYLVEQTKNLPSNRAVIEEGDAADFSVLADFAKGMDTVTHPAVWPWNEDPAVLEVFNKAIQAVIIGEKTPAAAARDVQKAKLRQLQKVKR